MLTTYKYYQRISHDTFLKGRSTRTNHHHQKLSKYFSADIRQNSSDVQNITCVFWDFDAENGRGDWSPEGCYLSNVTEDNVECKCNHLTNFAVLMVRFID